MLAGWTREGACFHINVTHHSHSGQCTTNANKNHLDHLVQCCSSWNLFWHMLCIVTIMELLSINQNKMCFPICSHQIALRFGPIKAVYFDRTHPAPTHTLVASSTLSDLIKCIYMSPNRTVTDQYASAYLLAVTSTDDTSTLTYLPCLIQKPRYGMSEGSVRS